MRSGPVAQPLTTPRTLPEKGLIILLIVRNRRGITVRGEIVIVGIIKPPTPGATRIGLIVGNAYVMYSIIYALWYVSKSLCSAKRL